MIYDNETISLLKQVHINEIVSLKDEFLIKECVELGLAIPVKMKVTVIEDHVYQHYILTDIGISLISDNEESSEVVKESIFRKILNLIKR